MKKIKAKVKQVKSNIRHCVFGRIVAVTENGNVYKFADTKIEPKTQNFSDGGNGWRFLADFSNTEEGIENATDFALEWTYEVNAELHYKNNEDK